MKASLPSPGHRFIHQKLLVSAPDTANVRHLLVRHHERVLLVLEDEKPVHGVPDHHRCSRASDHDCDYALLADLAHLERLLKQRSWAFCWD